MTFFEVAEGRASCLVVTAPTDCLVDRVLTGLRAVMGRMFLGADVVATC